MSIPSTIIALSAPVAIEAKSSKVPTFEATIYNGGALEVGGYDKPVVIDLAGLGRGNVLVANLDHDSTKRVGNFDVENDGRKLLARGTASAATPSRDEVVNSAKQGYTWQASVEVQPKKIEPVNAGESVTVNGQSFVGPVYVTRKGTLKGFAFVSHGADDSTTVSIAAKRKKRMSDFQSWAAECGLDCSLMTAAQMAGIRANYNGRSEPTDEDHTAVAPMIVASGDPVAVEDKRLRQIEAACRGEWSEAEQVNELRAAAVGGELSVDDLLAELRNIRKEQTMDSFNRDYDGNPITLSVPRAPRGDVNGKLIEAALCLNGGMKNIEAHFDERVLEQADGIRRGMSLHTILMEAAAANGYRARPGESVSDGNLKTILAHAFAPIRAAGFSTVSIPDVVSNVANKNLLQGFQEMGDEWRTISEVKSVKNFKEHKFIRLLDNLPFEEVAPGGELKHGTLGDDAITGQAGTYGVILGITRTDIINDDLSALTDGPRRVGRSGGQKLRRLFWTLFMSSDSFYSEGNGNLIDGVLTDDGADLAAALIAFRAMRSPAEDGSRLLGGAPAVMLVHPNDEITARRLIQSSGIVAGGGSDATTVGNANPFANLAKLVVVDWLADTSLGGDADGHAFYLFRAPSLLPAMLVLALNGRVEPTVETSEADFSTLGILMRGYSDIGVARGEPLAGLMVSGEAAGS